MIKRIALVLLLTAYSAQALAVQTVLDPTPGTGNARNPTVMSATINANGLEVNANTLKDTNVPTALSVGTIGVSTVAITSDGGADDVTLPAATNLAAGVVTAAQVTAIETSTSTNSTQDTAIGLNTTHTASDGKDHSDVVANTAAILLKAPIASPTFTGTVVIPNVTGADANIVSGTAGTGGNCSEWNVDGDLVDAGAPCGTGGGAALDTQDEGVSVETATDTINFIGSGVTATPGVAGTVDVTIAAGAAPIDSVFGRTGTVIAESGDYTASQVGLPKYSGTFTTTAIVAGGGILVIPHGLGKLPAFITLYNPSMVKSGGTISADSTNITVNLGTGTLPTETWTLVAM